MLDAFGCWVYVALILTEYCQTKNSCRNSTNSYVEFLPNLRVAKKLTLLAKKAISNCNFLWILDELSQLGDFMSEIALKNKF